jgi:hypothetical protein
VPNKSYFHEIKVTANKIKEGIRCIKRGRITSNPLYSEKTSSENKDKNKTKPMLKTLGSQ